MKLKHSEKGMTLIETVVYVAIIVVMVVFLVDAIFSMFFAFSRARASNRLTADGVTALERITREIRLASAVNLESSFASNPSVLALDTVKSVDDQTPVIKKFYVSGGRIVLEESGGIEYLTSPQASTSLFYLDFIQTSHSSAIRIQLTMEGNSRSEVLSRSFFNSVLLRGSY